MNLLLVFQGFIVAFAIVIYYEYKIRNLFRKSKNNARFYVARDKNGSLWIYMNKPVRYDTEFRSKTNIYLTNQEAKHFGLKKNDYDNLKWEDEPLEVFVNIKD